jgi:hypothetical protein
MKKSMDIISEIEQELNEDIVGVLREMNYSNAVEAYIEKADI